MYILWAWFDRYVPDDIRHAKLSCIQNDIFKAWWYITQLCRSCINWGNNLYDAYYINLIHMCIKPGLLRTQTTIITLTRSMDHRMVVNEPFLLSFRGLILLWNSKHCWMMFLSSSRDRFVDENGNASDPNSPVKLVITHHFAKRIADCIA